VAPAQDVPPAQTQNAPLTQAQNAPLTMQRAVELALARNERASIADTTVDAAEARVRRARTAFLPRVDIAGTWRADYLDPTERTLQASALLTQPIFDARAFPLYRQQRFERDAARLSATDTKRLLGFDAAIAFLGTLGFEQVLRAAEHRRDFAQTNLADVSARFEAGLVSSNDVTRAELELATAERGVAQAAGDVQAARVDLGTLLNSDVGTLVPPAALLDAAAHPLDVDEAGMTGARQRRTDIAAQQARVAALRAFAEETSARFVPSVLFSAQTRNANDGPVTNRNNLGFMGVTLAWPVFDAGLRKADRAERNALVRGEELALEAALRDVDRQMLSAGVQLSTEQAALRQAAAALRAARKNAEETNALYREGLASALELADANQQLFGSEVAEVTARYRMAVAYLAVKQASGVEAVP